MLSIPFGVHVETQSVNQWKAAIVHDLCICTEILNTIENCWCFHQPIEFLVFCPVKTFEFSF